MPRKGQGAKPGKKAQDEAPGRRRPVAGPAKGHVRAVGILSTLSSCRVTLGCSLSVPSNDAGLHCAKQVS